MNSSLDNTTYNITNLLSDRITNDKMDVTECNNPQDNKHKIVELISHSLDNVLEIVKKDKTPLVSSLCIGLSVEYIASVDKIMGCSVSECDNCIKIIDNLIDKIQGIAVMIQQHYDQINIIDLAYYVKFIQVYNPLIRDLIKEESDITIKTLLMYNMSIINNGKNDMYMVYIRCLYENPKAGFNFLYKFLPALLKYWQTDSSKASYLLFINTHNDYRAFIEHYAYSIHANNKHEIFPATTLSYLADIYKFLGYKNLTCEIYKLVGTLALHYEDSYATKKYKLYLAERNLYLGHIDSYVVGSVIEGILNEDSLYYTAINLFSYIKMAGWNQQIIRNAVENYGLLTPNQRLSITPLYYKSLSELTDIIYRSNDPSIYCSHKLELASRRSRYRINDCEEALNYAKKLKNLYWISKCVDKMYEFKLCDIDYVCESLDIYRILYIPDFIKLVVKIIQNKKDENSFKLMFEASLCAINYSMWLDAARIYRKMYELTCDLLPQVACLRKSIEFYNKCNMSDEIQTESYNVKQVLIDICEKYNVPSSMICNVNV